MVVKMAEQSCRLLVEMLCFAPSSKIKKQEQTTEPFATLKKSIGFENPTALSR